MHEERLRSFIRTWGEAREAGVVLPETDDPAYESMEALLHHVLRAAAGYMTWCCEVLGLPDPGMPGLPGAAEAAKAPEAHAEAILDRWRAPLAGVGAERLEADEYRSRWKTKYCVDAMLEHAVMHPMRHEFQLRRLAGGREPRGGAAGR